MKSLASGAVLALLWLLLGLPLAAPAAVVSAVVQPVTVAFTAGLLARPHLTGRRWTR
ncbi:hypothetical protein [Streptomyces sp. CAI-85]|uniref:hypothetical protein n=1 Tax=Streptomyces sp. CAI-85 TaxID=1472662 RepID=UPI001587060A|nr:hypothetical protein [Streptomyces sp. CAI-85]NUV60676.1 hypothetical protein [Streptomyces sp. CAI-85]